MWLKDSIASRERGDIKEGINVKDSVWIEIRDCRNSKILVGCFCRALGVKEEEEEGVHEEFKRACGKGRVLIMGDFNLPGIDWVQEQGKGRADEDFLVLVQDCFLTQFVDKPTRGSAVFDLLLSNDPNMVEEIEVGEHFDHTIVYATIMLRVGVRHSSMKLLDVCLGLSKSGIMRSLVCRESQPPDHEHFPVCNPHASQ